VPKTSLTVASSQIRGSTLLLGGSVLGSGVDFLAQILLVRYLSKSEFGAWIYALAIVALFASLAGFEMRQVVARFLPRYLERGEIDKLRGAIKLAFGVILGLGGTIAIAIIVAISATGLRPTSDPEALRLLVIMAFLVPIQALDSLFNGLFAAFGATRAIFLRQSVVAPGLRLVVVASLIASRADVTFLAIAYMMATFAGMLLYVVAFKRLLRSAGALKPDGAVSSTIPAREMFYFAVPLLTSTLVWILMETSDAVLLGYFFDSEAVANFRVVLPLARMNQLVAATFGVLYLSLAARAYEGHDRAELQNLYWQTTLWMTVLSFPILLLTLSFAPSVTVGLYGEAYRASAPILALLAVGYFFNTALGFNGVTLKVHNRLRYMVLVDISMAVVNVGVNLALIPRLGPLGAAVGTSGTLILHNILKQIGLWRYTSIGVFHRPYARLYIVIAALSLSLLGFQALVPGNLVIACALSGAGGLILLWLARTSLDFGTMFPELRRVRLPRWIR
jgi:Membrane protein involved in the export of O-antigen and teichoic acid